MRTVFCSVAALIAGCSGSTDGPAASVVARVETQPVGTAHADAADDPAIWRNPADPAASLIVATDKKAGLYVYGLDGTVRSFLKAGKVNNVDLLSLGDRVLVAASDRTDKANAKIALFWLDPATAKLAEAGSIAAGDGEAYGFCMAPVGTSAHAFLVLKDGTIRDFALAMGADGAISGSLSRTMPLTSQAEGCVADPATDALFVGEEDVAIWRFPLTGTATTGRKVASVGDGMLVADIEGLTVARPATGQAMLLASSQGDNAYAAFSLPELKPIGRFRIVKGVIDGTSETDGIAADSGDFGPAFPGGLFVAQDGDNAPDAQNFKLVALDDIRAALRRGK